MLLNGVLYSKEMQELHNLHALKKLKYTDKVRFKINGEWVETTYGRLIIWELSGLLVNEPLGKSSVKKLVTHINNAFPKEEAIKRLKKLQDLGFQVATESGISLEYKDFVIPGYQDDISQLQQKLIRDQVPVEERWEKVDTLINQHVSEWKENTDHNNALYLMYKSGARVTDPQIRQIVIAKGLLSEMDGSISKMAIAGSLGRGLDSFDYFRTCGPARRGLANNFFVVPASGYFARQLVNCARDLRIVEDDCGCNEGIEIEARFALGKYMIDGTKVTKEFIEEDPSRLVTVRSALTCKCNKGGLCRKCVGDDPATGNLFYMGFGVGTAAAQHLTEPATQLGLRGKHTSGSINLKEYKNGISNVLIDIIHSFGAVSTSNMSASESASKTIYDFLEDDNNDAIKAATHLAEYITNLYINSGITISFQWPEIIMRACTDQVDTGHGVGLRSYGDSGEILVQKVNRCACHYPSWLKSCGFGYVKQRLIEALNNCEVSRGSYTEQVITTRIQKFDEE